MRSSSRQYPSYSLLGAIVNVKLVHAAGGDASQRRSDVALILGYSSHNGAADKSIGTLKQFGLLESSVANEVRISPLAMIIIKSRVRTHRMNALQLAAHKPPLFKALREKFGEVRIEMEVLADYLLEEGFAERAIKPVFRAYNDTIELQELNFESFWTFADAENPL